MKSGFLRWLADKSFQNLPAFGVMVLTLSASQYAPSKWMGWLFVFAGSALTVAVSQVASLRERVSRLEHLLTAFTPESAEYRREIISYDRNPAPPLILPPDQ